MVNVHTYSDTATAQRMAAEAVQQTLSEFNSVPILFMVSGGSALHVLNALPGELFGSRFTLSVVDERFTTDPAINNYLQLTNTDFYHKAVAQGVSVIETVPQEKEAIEELAKRFEGELKAWRMSHPDGVIVTLIGIGKDGHTAGMMGYPDDVRTFQFMFEDADVWVAGYDAKWRNMYPLRVTVTMPFLRKANATIVYAVGGEKKKAINLILAPSGELYRTPGRIINELQHCHLYTDQSVDTVGV